MNDGSQAARIAILEDDEQEYRQLERCILEYAKENAITVHIKWYSDGIGLLMSEDENYDIMFLDIEMKHVDGMTAAKKIREKDQAVCLIFVTHLSQYAIRGYEVNALDFVLKPVTYPVLSDKLRKAFAYSEWRKKDRILIQAKDESFVLPASDIYYIEKDKKKNTLVYYTSRGELRLRGTITEEEERLLEHGFVRSTSGCLVNLAHVTQLGKDTVSVHGTELAVSRQRKKELQDRLIEYLQKGV